MRGMTLYTVARAIKGQLRNAAGSGKITGVTIDSRQVRPGELFFALPGKRVNGQKFFAAAIDAGAIAGISRRIPPGLPGIQVRDPRRALGDLLAVYRRGFPRFKVVAVTGSNGKTATKEMLAHILARRWRILESQGNYNNDLGLPLTLAHLTSQHQVGVLEMGMNTAGEIRRLAQIAQPGVGIITNIGDAHRGRFPNQMALARAKVELLQELIPPAKAVLNADDPHLVPWIARFPHGLTFGLASQSGVRILSAGVCWNGTYGVLRYRGQQAHLQLRVLGVHQLWNAAAAIAGAISLGFGFRAAVQALQGFKQRTAMRLQYLRLGPHRVIHDAYNSNPQSAAAALALLTELTTAGKKIFIAGSMLELGSYSVPAHQELGHCVVRAGISVLITVGAEARGIAQGARRAGMKTVQSVASASAVLPVLLPHLSDSGDLLLVKGSRAMQLEKAVEDIQTYFHKKLRRRKAAFRRRKGVRKAIMPSQG